MPATLSFEVGVTVSTARSVDDCGEGGLKKKYMYGCNVINLVLVIARYSLRLVGGGVILCHFLSEALSGQKSEDRHYQCKWLM